ncbi:hypothetical protein H2203_001936 [Taxawa tesnikishii (nom. ined.)]|nr:hypothetical protein H2203_001936 [Dothideales sp. JES 119]
MTTASSQEDTPDDTPDDGLNGRQYPSAAELLERCQALFQELEDFRKHLKSKKQEHDVELGHFRNTVRSEIKVLERLAAAEQPTEEEDDESAEATQHTVASSNLPFLESLWNTVKASTGLVSVQKRFYWDIPKEEKRKGNAAKPLDKRKHSALVDVVSKDGLEWTKVSLITNTRLLFDLAKQGWEVGDTSSEEDDDVEDVRRKGEGDEDSDIPLVRMTKDLFKAAQGVRIKTQHPRIRLVLPKMEEGQIEEVDRILASLRKTGATVHCSNEAPVEQTLSAVLHNLTSDPLAGLTPTLNIDCTILLAIVSDFSHCDVNAEPWFHRALKRQVEIEEEENLLPNLLYPAIRAHALVCTQEAAKRMREIVDTIGTPGEKVRTALLMGDDAAKSLAQIHAELVSWSKFAVPEDLQLPIRIVNKDSADGALPPVAERVQQRLTAINQSVFLYGWATGHAVVTSNRTVVKQIEHILNEYAESEKDWPNIWLCPTARSLVGKEKGRRD